MCDRQRRRIIKIFSNLLHQREQWRKRNGRMIKAPSECITSKATLSDLCYEQASYKRNGWLGLPVRDETSGLFLHGLCSTRTSKLGRVCIFSRNHVAPLQGHHPRHENISWIHKTSIGRVHSFSPKDMSWGVDWQNGPLPVDGHCAQRTKVRFDSTKSDCLRQMCSIL